MIAHWISNFESHSSDYSKIESLYCLYPQQNNVMNTDECHTRPERNAACDTFPVQF